MESAVPLGNVMPVWRVVLAAPFAHAYCTLRLVPVTAPLCSCHSVSGWLKALYCHWTSLRTVPPAVLREAARASRPRSFQPNSSLLTVWSTPVPKVVTASARSQPRLSKEYACTVPVWCGTADQGTCKYFIQCTRSVDQILPFGFLSVLSPNPRPTHCFLVRSNV